MHQRHAFSTQSRHDRLFELIRQKNMAKKVAKKLAAKPRPELLDTERFFARADLSLKPRVRVESPLRLQA